MATTFKTTPVVSYKKLWVLGTTYSQVVKITLTVSELERLNAELEKSPDSAYMMDGHEMVPKNVKRPVRAFNELTISQLIYLYNLLGWAKFPRVKTDRNTLLITNVTF